MKTYKFIAEAIIEAESEEKAKEKFVNNSFDFAANAEVEEIKVDIDNLLRQ